MKSISIMLSMAMILSMFSCQEKTEMEVHTANAEQLNVIVVNAVDPVCEMEMPKFLKDTLTYHHEIYGFCNASCKNEFKANPDKYLPVLKQQ